MTWVKTLTTLVVMLGDVRMAFLVCVIRIQTGGDTCGKQTDFNDSTPDTPIFNQIILILKRFHPGGFNDVMYK